jgi:hypothetical protein
VLQRTVRQPSLLEENGTAHYHSSLLSEVPRLRVGSPASRTVLIVIQDDVELYESSMQAHATRLIAKRLTIVVIY